jgi:hypothetical protein
MKTTRRVLAAAALLFGLVTLAALPASAQVETLYTGVTPPVIAAGTPNGGVLAISGERAVPAQVLPAQTAGAVAATAGVREQGLAFTGADIVGLVTFGLSLVAIGMVLTRRGRARTLPRG